MVTVVRCPSCGAPLKQALPACPFCKVALAWPGQPAPSPQAGPEVPAEVVEALRSGNKIGAIKAYHTAYKCGLKEAKDFVDALERKLGLA